MKLLLWFGLIAALPAAPFSCSCRRLKWRDNLLPIVIWLPSNLRFGSDLHLSGLPGLTPRGDWAHTIGRGASLWLCSHLLLYLQHVCCHQKSTEHTCVFQQPQQSGSSRTSPPVGHFWLSKITSWVDYMLSSTSPNYSPELRGTVSSQGNGVVSKHAPPGLGGGRARSQRAHSWSSQFTRLMSSVQTCSQRSKDHSIKHTEGHWDYYSLFSPLII